MRPDLRNVALDVLSYLAGVVGASITFMVAQHWSTDGLAWLSQRLLRVFWPDAVAYVTIWFPTWRCAWRDAKGGLSRLAVPLSLWSCKRLLWTSLTVLPLASHWVLSRPRLAHSLAQPPLFSLTAQLILLISQASALDLVASMSSL